MSARESEALRHKISMEEETLLRKIGNIPADLASVEERQLDGDGPLIALIRNEPWNVGVQRSIFRLLDSWMRSGAIRFVGVDGAYGYIRTEALGAFPIPEVRNATADRFLESLTISGAEYCHVKHFNPDKEFAKILCGLEDAGLYERASKLWKSMGPLQHDRRTGLFRSSSRKMRKFIDLEFDRAKAMFANLQHRMQVHELHTAAVVATGNLPEVLTWSLRPAGFRWALIRPLSTTQGDLKKYLDHSKETPGAIGVLAKLIAAVDRETGGEPIDWPEDGDWELLRVDQIREMNKTGGEPLKKDLSRLLCSRAYRDMAREEKLAVLDELGTVTFMWVEDAVPDDVLEELGQDEVQKRRAAALLLLLDPDGAEFAELARVMPDEHAAFVMASKQLNNTRRERLVEARKSAATGSAPSRRRS